MKQCTWDFLRPRVQEHKFNIGSRTWARHTHFWEMMAVPGRCLLRQNPVELDVVRTVLLLLS